jgi:adenosylcobinamide kinase / adenosylcobinamide-phosphate guanylyltransferase
VPGDCVLVVDCLGTCFGLAMLEAWESTAGTSASMSEAAQLPPGYEALLTARLRDIVERILARNGDTIVVTNEVGSGLVPAYATGRIFRDELGRANAALIGRADRSCLAVGGRLLDLAALPRDISWPED